MDDFWTAFELNKKMIDSWPDWKKKVAQDWWQRVQWEQQCITEQLNYCNHCGRDTGGRRCYACYG